MLLSAVSEEDGEGDTQGSPSRKPQALPTGCSYSMHQVPFLLLS